MFLSKFWPIFKTCLVTTVCVFGLAACDAEELPTLPHHAPTTHSNTDKSPKVNSMVRQFEYIYEPSGVTQMANGEILVIEDEARQAISVLSFAVPGSVIRIPVTRIQSRLGRLEDLEGIAQSEDGHFYAITSHSKTLKRRLPTARKKLIRFSLNNYEVHETVLISDVKKKILNTYKSLRKNVSGRKSDLNIEALSYHRKKKQLMLGLRTPLVKGNAVIIRITNPDQAFLKKGGIKLANKLMTLDLDQGGIRAMTYDKTLEGYLILSRREDKKDKSFKLWLWDGHAQHKPRRIHFDENLDLDAAEGVTPISITSMDGLLIVFDDGNTQKAKGAHYVLVPYDQLHIATN
ncbi:MAG TPA: DUF3616 domain-containing protein [Gammaproteobacteria bacterium]|nr:DUF3616 domain-containing protein [Gammaproteobacteria bacterium]